MNGKILIIVHQEQSTPGRVGLMLKARGLELDIRRPCIGHDLPEDVRPYAGVVIFGGPMSANDDDTLDFIRAELDWIDRPLKQNVPFLGICLGAQLLARHLGAAVAEHPENYAEVGYYPIKPTRAGEEICPWPGKVYQWHREGFEIPSGCEVLAQGGTAFPNQAFRHGQSAYGIQFHPEVTLAMMHRWTVKARHRFELPGARPPESHFDDRRQHDGDVARWLSEFLDHWLG